MLFVGIIVIEVELLEEMEVEEIIDDRKKIFLLFVGKFLMVLLLIGKVIVDNEIYEFLEIGGDIIEEKLLLIEEVY